MHSPDLHNESTTVQLTGEAFSFLNYLLSTELHVMKETKPADGSIEVSE